MSTTNGSTKLTTVNVVESLWAYDDTWTPQPMLVDAVDITDGDKNFRITLREVKFHNGQPLTADDVVASIKRMMVVDSGSKVWLSALTSLTALDDRTVEIRFSEPNPSLPTYLAETTAGIIPAEVADAVGENVLKPEQLIGTGPFMFEDWQPGVSITLRANPNYQPVEGKPSGLAGKHVARVEKLVFKPVLDESARLAGLQTGEFNYAEVIPTDQYETVKADSNIKLALRNVGNVTAYLNTRSDVTSNSKIRKALLVALDMEKAGIAQGPKDLWNLSPAVPASTNRFANDVGAADWNAADPARAQQLAKEAGYAGETLKVISTSSPNTYRFAVVLQEQLKAAGFKVELETMQTAGMQQRRAQPTGWHIAMGQLNTSADITMVNPLACGNTVGGYCSEEMNKLLEAFRSAPDSEKQSKQDAIQTLIYQDVPYIKGPEVRLLNATNGLEGFEQSDLSVAHFWNTWLTRP